MLGLPHSSAIAFGNADKAFTAPAYDAYITDDWRVSPMLTINAGARWEYEGPIDERLGRLSNLAVAPGFTAVRPGRRQRSDPRRTGAACSRASAWRCAPSPDRRW